jgi:Fe-S cluster assembly ATP-binding protein
MLTIENLHASIEEKPILKGMDLQVPDGEVHAIMGPNGSGKSTLSNVIAGHEDYEITGGRVLVDGDDLAEYEPEERAAKGVFLSFQHPVEIPGVPVMTFLRTALNAVRKARGEDELNAADFMKRARQAASELKIDPDMLKRPLNVGFSGGEKKRMEILQLSLLEPKIAILDETDSGLDIDALKLVAEGVNRMRGAGRSFLIITHYQRLLDHVRPDVVHIMADGQIKRTGGPDLAAQLEREGYDTLIAEAA